MVIEVVGLSSLSFLVAFILKLIIEDFSDGGEFVILDNFFSLPIEWIIDDILPDFFQFPVIADNVFVIISLPDIVNIGFMPKPFGYTNFETADD